jgi:hypothetical protein
MIARNSGEYLAKRQQMDCIEKIAGGTTEELRERDWPSRDAMSNFFSPPGFLATRGSVRLAAGLVVDRTQIKEEWEKVKTALLEML